jgi:hypothetical protein
LAALVVFVMTTGAFVGAADKSLINSDDDTTNTSIEIETLDHATYTEEDVIDPTTEQETSFNEIPNNEVSPVVPANSIIADIDGSMQNDFGPEDQFTSIEDANNLGEFNNNMNIDGEMGLMDNLDATDKNMIKGSNRNKLSEAMSYITTNGHMGNGESSSSAATRSRAGPITWVVGTDNDQYPGTGTGYLYRSGSTYRSYDNYAMYNYQSGTSFEYHGFAVTALRCMI